MSASKRPSTSSLRRFITSRPYVPVAELRRRFGLDEPDAMAHLHHHGSSAWIGLPEREAAKLQELWDRGELGVELSVEVRAPVIVGVYPMRIARYVIEGFAMNGAGNGHGAGHGNGTGHAHGQAPGVGTPPPLATSAAGGEAAHNGHPHPAPGWRGARPAQAAAPRPHQPPRPMSGAPTYRPAHRPEGG